jgi:hypothetical protein
MSRGNLTVTFHEKNMMTDAAELPLQASPCVELRLTDDQIEALTGVIELQRCRPRGQIFMCLASSYMPELGKGVLRLQFKLVDRKDAVKVLKILRGAVLE